MNPYPIEKREFLHEIKSLREKLRDLQQLTAAVEQAAESVVITDPNGAIVYVNPAFTKSTGYTRDEAIGENPRILKSEE